VIFNHVSEAEHVH